MRPVIHSLNTKLLLIVTGFVILSGILGAVRVGIAESGRIERLYHDRLEALSTRYITHIRKELDGRVGKLESARQLLLDQLSKPLVRKPDLTEQADGAYRSYNDASGVFVHREQPITPEVERQVVASGQAWGYLAPVLAHSFNALYFISEQRVSRVWPKTIVENHKPTHDVRGEIFYRVATPAQNPAREPRWTPIYYDTYSDHWMTSLILPVYKGEEFIGVIGGDLNVSYLLTRLADLDVDSDQIRAFVFDESNQVMLRSNRGHPQAYEGDKNYALLRDDSPTARALKPFMKQVTAGQHSSGSIVEYGLSGKSVNIVANRMAGMDWYIAFYYPQALIDKRFRESMRSVYVNVLVLAGFLFLVLFFSVRHFVVRRIAALARATTKIDRDNWHISVPDKGADEISRLGKSINNMLDQIRHLVRGLDDKIFLLDKASHESRQLMSAIENSASLVVILNEHWQLEYANSQFWQVSGLDAHRTREGYETLLLQPGNEQGITLESISSTIHRSQQQHRGGEDAGRWQDEYQARDYCGEIFWLMQTITAINGPDGEPDFYVCVGQDITDLKEKQQEVEKLAYYDHLTGLANRTQFKNSLRAALHRTHRTGERLALLYLDLDHFKRINDTFGHEAGDRLLVAVAHQLQDCMREEDVVARLGGDEFAVLVDPVESPQYAFVVASKIIEALNRPIEIAGKEVVAGVSIGITLAPDDSGEIDALMKNADLAMYQAKEKGRNAFQFYTADMNRIVEQRLTIDRELRSALHNHQFELYYQPLIDLSTGQVVGAEALIRWNHPTRGLVSPGEFIPAAEESGLIVPLGRWVLKSACYQARAIQKALQRDFKMSVNLSARQLNDNSFLSHLDRVLELTRLSPASLELEVTESMLMEDAANVIPRLEKIRSKGCSLAIDDFGTGYSSLSYLKRLPINSLKVDRSFVKDLPDDEEDRAITSLIVAMAKSLRYKVVVEGVETSAQHEFLSGRGCHYGQGFLYSRPLPADEFLRFVHERE